MSLVGRPPSYVRETALLQCLETFWCKGYEATSLGDLLEATGLSKSSFYAAFGTKKTLFEECLTRYAANVVEGMRQLRAAEPRGLAFLEKLLGSVTASAETSQAAKGCLMVNTAIEFGLGDPAVSARMGRGLDEISGIFLDAIRQAQERGEIPPRKKAHELVLFLHVGISGLRAMIKTGADRASAEAVARHLLASLTSPVPSTPPLPASPQETPS